MPGALRFIILRFACVPDSVLCAVSRRQTEKARRSHRLQAEADAVRARVIAGLEGRPVEVLLEKPVNNTLFTGYTREYVPVLLKAPGHRQGGIVHAVLGAFDGTRCTAALAE